MAYAPQMSDLSLGARLRLARLQAGLTTAELARRLGVARETVSAWEHGRQEPKASYLRAIAEVTGSSADWILFGATRA